jgi:GNAT superfamily N-acetyltransferase
MDDATWQANITPLPWVEDVYLQNATELIAVLRNPSPLPPSVMSRRYIIAEPGEVMVRTELRLGSELYLSPEYAHIPFIDVSTIVVHHTHQGIGFAFLQDLITEARRYGYGATLSGGYNLGSLRLAEKLGMVRNGFYQQFIIT